MTIHNNNNRSAIWLQLTAGQGPKECGWVVTQLARAMIKAANKVRLSAEIVESLAFDKHLRNQTTIEPDAFLSILIRIEGNNADTFAKQWQGTIKWQGESIYRPKHKRINWFVGVAVLDMPKRENINTYQLEKEVDIESMRARGAGGQHINKTNSAVRIKHRPTGLTVRIETDRSQHRNKQIALERLQLLLAQRLENEKSSIERIRWLQHYDVKRGSAIRTFLGPEFSECY